MHDVCAHNLLLKLTQEKKKKLSTALVKRKEFMEGKVGVKGQP